MVPRPPEKVDANGFWYTMLPDSMINCQTTDTLAIVGHNSPFEALPVGKDNEMLRAIVRMRWLESIMEVIIEITIEITACFAKGHF